MNKLISFTVMLLMGTSLAFSQKAVTGKVIDAATHQCLAGATITDLQNKINRISDQNGNFSLPEKTDSIQVSSVGYYSVTLPVNGLKVLISRNSE